MRHASFLLAIVVFSALVNCSGPGRKPAPDRPVVITQVPFEYLNDSTVNLYLSDLKKSDVSVVLLSLVDVFVTGQERDTLLSKLHYFIGLFEKEGFETGVWTTSLGYGNYRPQLDSRYPGLTKLKEFGGNTGGAVCSTDTVFLGIIKENVRDFARAGARFILMDDELVQSVRPGFTCVCDNHLAMLKEATGKEFTPEQVRDLFTGPPSADRTAFLDIMGRSLTDFCKGLREAVDEVDPGIVMAICASYTHFDAEGVDMDELSRLLAGKGNTPFLRLSGATYWPIVAPRFPGQTLGDVADFVRMQVGWYRDRGIVLFDENDPYPRNTETVPPSLCELYDKIMIANGGVHRHKYMCCYDPVNPERGYVEAHLADIDDDRTLERMFIGKTPCGFRVWNAEHQLRDITLPDTYPGNGPMMALASHSSAAAFLDANCIPACFEGSGFPGIVFGDQARLLPPEALSGGLVLDVPAARALMTKGVDVGLADAVPVDSLGCPFYSLTPRPDVESNLMDPSCLLCRTKDGVFAIFGWDGYGMLTLSERPWRGDRWANLLKEIYHILSGGKDLPASLSGTGPLYLLTSLSKEGDKLSVLLCNMGNEEISGQELSVPEGWTISETLRTEIEPNTAGGTLRLSPLPAQSWCAVSFIFVSCDKKN